MIMGHVGFGEAFDHFIHAFHMPMFFFISGFLHKENSLNFKEFITKKINSLILPYFSFGILYYLIWLVLFRNGDSLSPLEHLFFVNTEGLPIAGALWFLTALFFTYLLVYLIQTKIKIIWIKVLVIITLSLFGCLETTLLTFRLPYALGASCVGLGLFYLGKLVSHSTKYSKVLLDLGWLKTLILILITIPLIFLNGYVNMRTGSYSNLFLFWINALFSCIILINVSKLFYNIRKRRNILSYLVKFDQSIGKNSISYVCLNQFVILILVKVLDLIIPTNQILFILISRIIILILSILIIYILDKLIRKTALKKFIGIK